jgi:hypothetical protein
VIISLPSSTTTRRSCRALSSNSSGAKVDAPSPPADDQKQKKSLEEEPKNVPVVVDSVEETKQKKGLLDHVKEHGAWFVMAYGASWIGTGAAVYAGISYLGPDFTVNALKVWFNHPKLLLWLTVRYRPWGWTSS